MGEKIVILTDSLDGPTRIELDVTEMTYEELKKHALNGSRPAMIELTRRKKTQ